MTTIGNQRAMPPTGRRALASASMAQVATRVGLRSPAWPLAVLLVGFPLWWILGMANLMPIIVAVPMAHQLLQRHPVRVPSGFGLWLVFLMFVVVGVAVLWVDAPGAVPGGGGARLIVFGYRLLWYLAVTVVLLWVGNLSEAELPTRLVVRLLSWMFVVTVGGGLLGVLMPRFEITSLVEMVVPRGLRSNGFVRSLLHPKAANESRFLGRSQFRPMAPYAFANSWGANYAMFLPFFVLGWFGKHARPAMRRVAPFVLAVSAIPVVYSLNRGLWLSLGLGVAFVVVRFALVGRVGALAGSVGIVIVGIALFLASPLASLTQERLDNAHSNDRRGALLSLTVSSTFERSPVVGFGSTRDVQGSFASIAGGATPDCSACEVPPLGTQGAIWLVIFSQGLVGAAFFVAFFAVQAGRHLSARTPVEAAGLCLLLFLFFQMFVYDLVGLPLFTLMVAVGLMWRTRARRLDTRSGWNRLTLEAMFARLRRGAVVVVALALAGGAAGGALALRRPAVYNARGAVLLAPTPVYLDPLDPDTAREITVDTEAALVFAEATIDATVAEAQLGVSASDLRERIYVTAPALTKVLNIDVRDVDKARAERTVAALVANYLAQRQAYIEQRRVQAIAGLQLQLDELAGSGPDEAPDDDNAEEVTPLTRDELQEAIDALRMSRATGGEVLRVVPAVRVRAAPQVEVLSGVMVGTLCGLLVVTLMGAPREPRRRRRFSASDRPRAAATAGAG